MSREACDFCRRVVSTTGEPSSRAGLFFTNEGLDQLMMGGERPYHEWRDAGIRLVVCDECQSQFRQGRHPGPVLGVYRCDLCRRRFAAVVPHEDETNQDVACPHCHTVETGQVSG